MDKKILVLASANKGKIREISDMLPEFKVVAYKELGENFDIEETGETFFDNALIKAKAVSEKYDLPCLADDSGLCVEALSGAPGVYSARYSETGDDEDNNDLLLNNMQGVQDRRAKFVCCAVFYMPNGEVFAETGETFGEILNERQGKSGFGYDPVFYSFDLKKSFGLATEEEKNSVSHRSRAIHAIAAVIKEKLR